LKILFNYLKKTFLKVENHDREIERLHRVHEHDRSNEILKLEAKLISNEKLISHQNAQVNRKYFFIFALIRYFSFLKTQIRLNF